MTDRYRGDVLATDWRAPKNGRATEIDADLGLVVEEVTTDWCGEIVRVERDLGTVTLEERGIKAAYAVRGHTCDADGPDDDGTQPAPKQPPAPTPAPQ